MSLAILSLIPKVFGRQSAASDSANGGGTAALVVFSVLFGLLAAAVSGYVFGTIDHAEQLPIIYRLMDADYLVNDFQTNEASGFGPRFYFAHAVSAAGRLISIPVLYAVLYLMVYVAITSVTVFATRDLAGSVTAAIIAATLASSSLLPFVLSTPARVTGDPILIPRVLAMPFALYSLWKGVSGKPLNAACASVPAIFIQPTMGGRWRRLRLELRSYIRSCGCGRFQVIRTCLSSKVTDSAF